MKLEINTISGTNEKHKCYVHLRGASMGGGNLILTLQKLETTGIDTFHPLEVICSKDGGKTYTEPKEDGTFAPFVENGVRYVPCDAYPQYHRKTGKVIVVGTFGAYSEDGFNHARSPETMSFYSVYSPDEGKFSPIKIIRKVSDTDYNCISFGCVQFCEEENGDILIPAAIAETKGVMSTVVLRFSFDGEILTYKGKSNILKKSDGRGLYEPSIIKCDRKYILTMRNDNCAMYSVSDDGIEFSKPKLWIWDDGEVLPSYNTQAHFAYLNDKPYLVYTRKGVNNDHVFRHRAPLLMAEIDVLNECIKKMTEIIVVPERGARLGNFGVINEDKNVVYVTTSEWMQPEGCEKYGSDNTSYVVKISV